MTRVANEMTRRVVFALENDYLDDVWGSMKSIGVRHIPVLRDHKVVGILSDRDILRLARNIKGGGIHVPHQKISEVMTRGVITCSKSDSVAEVADTFIQHKIDALPVVDESGTLVGIITSTDLLKVLREKHEHLLKDLPFYWDPQTLHKEHWRPDYES